MNNLLIKGDGGPKTFWQKPEGVTGFIFLAGIVIGGGQWNKGLQR